MQDFLQTTRADARALFSAALAGAAVGLVLGGFYLAGGLANAANRQIAATRVAGAAGGHYADKALIAAPDADAGAVAVIRRRDPTAFTGELDQNRQIATLAGRLQRHAQNATADTGAALLLRTSFGGVYNPAAAPFRHVAVLDSSRELDCLTQAVYYEARGEGPSGQAAVAQVVLNRVRHPAFPKSVCGVVFQRAGARNTCQFSFACDGSVHRAREHGAWNRAQRVATRALAGSVMPEVGNATHFHTTGVAPSWGPRLLRVAQVGLHVFYRFGGRAGAPGAFTSQPDLSSPVDPAMDMMVASLAAGEVSGTALAAVATAVGAPPALVQGGVGGPAAAPGEPASALGAARGAALGAKPTLAPVAKTALAPAAKPAEAPKALPTAALTPPAGAVASTAS